MTDDQRYDVVTRTYMPNVYENLVRAATSSLFPNASGSAFTESFVSNPLCCPSRTTILTGNYSHTTGVWENGGRQSDGSHGGFGAFGDQDRHTIATDFHHAGYRTAMIGKYLNGYVAGENRYVPPGWDRWFAATTGAYYNYGITTDGGRLLHFGATPDDYITRVLNRKAVGFVENARAAGDPFFLYYAFTAPHRKSIPDPRDLTRFTGAIGKDGNPLSEEHVKMLESVYSVDRAIGVFLRHLPANTIVLYMSDNGFLWGAQDLTKGDRGIKSGKKWPYNESIRVPIIFSSLNGAHLPQAGAHDLVLNVDLRATLTHVVGGPRTSTEGLDWLARDYAPRFAFPLEHTGERVPDYCGVRTLNWMWVRYRTQSGYVAELYHEPDETANLIHVEAYEHRAAKLRALAKARCYPPPPRYRW